MLHPFLYRVCRLDPNCNRDAVIATEGLSEWHQGDNPEHGKDRFIVYIGSFVYTYQNMVWADDPRIGNNPLVPSLDMIQEEHEFDNEKDAMNFIQSWWMQRGYQR